MTVNYTLITMAAILGTSACFAFGYYLGYNTGLAMGQEEEEND